MVHAAPRKKVSQPCGCGLSGSGNCSGYLLEEHGDSRYKTVFFNLIHEGVNRQEVLWAY